MFYDISDNNIGLLYEQVVALCMCTCSIMLIVRLFLCLDELANSLQRCSFLLEVDKFTF